MPILTYQQLKQHGLSKEVVSFYVKMGQIRKIPKGDQTLYEVPDNFECMILEKSTVFRYCYNDSWQDDVRDYENFIKHTGKVKIYSKEEIAKLEEEMKKSKK